MATHSRFRLRAVLPRRLQTALLSTIALTVSLIAAPAFAFGSSGHGGGFAQGGFGHPGGDMFGGRSGPGHTFVPGHSGQHIFFPPGFHDRFHHPHGFVGGFVAVVPFGYPVYGPSAYDTYCNPGSPYYDPRLCWDYYNG